MKSFTLTVSSVVKVTFNEARFNRHVMSEFNECVSDFGTDDGAFERHAEHIAHLVANGEDPDPRSFWEGYGVLKEAGISISIDRNTDIEITDRAQ